MLGHRFEVQRERHEKSTTPGARARTSSGAVIYSSPRDALVSMAKAVALG
jgi:hypothetical protein